MHWQQCEDTYDAQIREYYSRRAAHQATLVRLNQVRGPHPRPGPGSQTPPPPVPHHSITPRRHLVQVLYGSNIAVSCSSAPQPQQPTSACWDCGGAQAPMAVSPSRPPLQQRGACNGTAEAEPMALCGGALSRKRSHEMCYDCAAPQQAQHTAVLPKRPHY